MKDREKLKMIWITAVLSFILIAVSAAVIFLVKIRNDAVLSNAPANKPGQEDFAEASVPSEADLPEPAPAEISFINDYFEQPLDFDKSYKPAPVQVKGIYVRANRAGIPSYFDPLVEMCVDSEVNAMVIDVKTDEGEVAFTNEIPAADEYGVSVNYIPDIRGILKTLDGAGIYPIARIAAFKDNGAARFAPDLYIKNADGSLWMDNSKSAWLNPYNRNSWDYIMEIAEGAVALGFKEIQFDYIRFDTSSRLADADFGDTQGMSRTQIISEFTKYAAEKINGWGAYVSADVYGTIIGSGIDAAIVGQDYLEMAKSLDYICPMVYPSHYADGNFGIDYPDTAPYDVVLNAMLLSNRALGGAEKSAVVRPWLQGFTASYLDNYITYTPEEIRKQIDAVYEAGLQEWLIWNSSSNYDAESFLPEISEAYND